MELACHDYDMAGVDYGTVCHENLFKFTQTTSGCDVAIGAPFASYHLARTRRRRGRLALAVDRHDMTPSCLDSGSHILLTSPD